MFVSHEDAISSSQEEEEASRQSRRRNMSRMLFATSEQRMGTMGGMLMMVDYSQVVPEVMSWNKAAFEEDDWKTTCSFPERIL